MNHVIWLLNITYTNQVIDFCTFDCTILYSFIMYLTDFCNIYHVGFNFTLFSGKNINASFLKFERFRPDNI